MRANRYAMTVAGTKRIFVKIFTITGFVYTEKIGSLIRYFSKDR